MQDEENIYNIIPKTPLKIAKPARYKSNYSHGIPPSYSTLCLKTTSVPGIANAGGDIQNLRVSHANVSASAVFGPLRDNSSLSPSNYLKKGVGTSIVAKSLDTTALKHHCLGKRDSVPKHDTVPLHGLKSNKNFVLANAVENILAAPTLAKEEMDWTKKKDYAKIPNYLQKVKEHLQKEYETVRDFQKKEEEQKLKEKYPMTPEEIDELREGLKHKWDLINRKFQNYAHITKIDTVGMKRRKENYEKELQVLEKDMEKLNKKYVFVDTTMKTGVNS